MHQSIALGMNEFVFFLKFGADRLEIFILSSLQFNLDRQQFPCVVLSIVFVT